MSKIKRTKTNRGADRYTEGKTNIQNLQKIESELDKADKHKRGEQTGIQRGRQTDRIYKR